MRLRVSLLLLSCWAIACSESFELYAPYQDIWVVYGVLNPGDTAQYIRISKAFQIEGNAFEYAAANDLTVKGLQVRLEGNGQSYLATQIDSVERADPDESFFPYLTLYRIDTPTDKPLVSGEVYQLSIQSETDSLLSLHASTRIPPEPTFVYPRLSGFGSNQCLVSVSFEDSARIIFKKQNVLSTDRAPAYQLQIDFRYRENGVAKTYRYGPTAPFTSSQNCTGVGTSNLCYLFDNGAVVNAMRGRLRNAQAAYSYEPFPSCGTPAEVSHAVEIEVVAIDSVLFRYITANDPGNFNINMIRREYTNITGAEAVGILGSVSTDRVPIALSPCAQHLLRLNGFFDPSACQ